MAGTRTTTSRTGAWTNVATVKTEVLSLLARLPDSCTLEDIQYHLYVLEKIRQGKESADQGDTIPHEEIDRQLERWRTDE